MGELTEGQRREIQSMIDGAVERATGFRAAKRDRPVHPHLEGDDGSRDHRRTGILARAHSAEKDSSCVFDYRIDVDEEGIRDRMRAEGWNLVPVGGPGARNYLEYYFVGALHRRRGFRSIFPPPVPMNEPQRRAAEMGLEDEDRLMAAERTEGDPSPSNPSEDRSREDSARRIDEEGLRSRLVKWGWSLVPLGTPRFQGYLYYYVVGALHRRQGNRSMFLPPVPMEGAQREAANMGFEDEGILMAKEKDDG